MFNSIPSFLKWFVPNVMVLIMTAFIIKAAYDIGYHNGERQTQRYAISKGHGFYNKDAEFEWFDHSHLISKDLEKLHKHSVEEVK